MNVTRCCWSKARASARPIADLSSARQSACTRDCVRKEEKWKANQADGLRITVMNSAEIYKLR